jgi:hypothetical protein
MGPNFFYHNFADEIQHEATNSCPPQERAASRSAAHKDDFVEDFRHAFFGAERARLFSN